MKRLSPYCSLRTWLSLGILLSVVLFSVAAFGQLIDNGNGTVTDTITNLTWQQVDNGQTMTWEEAMEYAATSSVGGCSDWRLPNRKELETIVDRYKFNPAIDTTLFPNTQSQIYWSGSPANHSNVWGIDFRSGRRVKVNPASHYLVRLVSAGCNLDRIPPQILSTNPPSGALNVDVAAPVLVSFNEAIAVDSVSSSSLYIDGVAGGLSVQGSVATFTPQASLGYATTYSVHVTTGVTDLAGNPLAAASSWNFTTAAPPDGDAPSGSVIIANGAALTSSTSVNLSLVATDNSGTVADMRLSTDGMSWNDWQPYTSSLTWELTAGDGLKSVFVQYRDGFGNISPSYSDSIELDSTPPALTIAQSAVTNQTSLNLTGTVESGASLLVSVPAPASAGAVSIAAGSWSCTISGLGNGDTKVTAVAEDAAGNQRTVQGTVTVDTLSPTGSIGHSTGEFTRSPLLTLNLSASDNHPGVIQVRLANAGTPWSPWQDLTSTVDWRLSDGDGLKTVNAQFMDAAGNLSSVVSTAVTLDATSPLLTISTPQVFTAATSVTLTGTVESGAALAVSGTTGLGLGSVSQPTAGTWQLTVSTIPTGQSTVTLTATDGAGNSSSVNAQISRDGEIPSGTLTINLGATLTSSRTVTLGLTAQDDIGVTQVRFVNPGSTWTAWQPFSSTASWTLPAGDGPKTVIAQLQDAAGNLSEEFSASITLDTTEPAVTIFPLASPTRLAAQTVSGSREAEATVSLSLDRGSVTALTYPSDTSWQAEVLLGEGTNNIIATATDQAHNSASAATSVVLDSLVDLAFDPVTSPTALTSQSLSGTREAGAILVLSGPSLQFGDVTYPDNTHWQTTVSNLQSGQNTIQLQGTDSLGNVSTINTIITLDTVPPSGSVVINNGATATGNPYVNLSLTASDNSGLVSKMRFSNDGQSWSSWFGYRNYAAWTLAAEDGDKTVYVQFQDAAGNISNNSSAQITLDSTAPLVTIDAVEPLITIAEQTLSGTMEAGATVTLSLPGQVLGSVSYPTATTWSADISLAEGVNPITVFATDSLGNRGSAATSMILDTIAEVTVLDYQSPTNLAVQMISGSREADAEISLDLPSGVSATGIVYPSATTWSTQLSGLQEGSNRITLDAVDSLNNTGAKTVTIVVDLQSPQGTVKINNDAPFCNKLTVSLNLVATDNVGPIRSVRMSNDGTNWSQWQDFQTSLAWTLTAGDGEKTVSVQFRDQAGNVSQSATDSITLDTVKPVISINPVITPTATSPLTVTGSMESGAQISASLVGGTLQSKQNDATTWQTVLLLKAGANTLYVSARDAAGNIATISQGIYYDTITTVSLFSVQSPTNVTSQTVRGGCEAGATVSLSLDTAAQAGSVSYPTETSWEAVVSNLQEGNNILTVTAVDGFGNQASTSGTIRLDTIPPSLTLDSVPATTNLALQTLTGSRETGAVISVSSVSSAQISYPTITTWQARINLVDGMNHPVIRATDAAGNQASLTADILLDRVVDLTITNLPSPTNQASQVLTGTIESGGTLEQIAADSTAVFGAVSVNGTAWSCPVTLAEGTNLITVSSSDALGNSSQDQLLVVLDTVAPQISIGSLPETTRQATQTLKGSVEEGATITVTAPGASVGPVTINGTTWSCSVTLPQGSTSVTAIAKDTAGNSASVGTSTVVDSQFLVSIDPLPLQTNQPVQTLSGQVEAGYTTLAVSVDTEAELGPLSVDNSTWQRSVTLVEGVNTISAYGSDNLGNAASAERSILLDTVPPQLTVDDVPAVTTEAQLTLTGTRDSGSMFSLTGASLQTVNYPTADTWRATVRLNEGENLLTIRLSDPAGNVSSQQIPVILDSLARFTVKPGLWQESPTTAASLVIEGTRETDVTLSVQVDNGGSAGAVIYADINWSCALTLAEGNNLISISATDAVGNISTWTREVVVDTTPPAAVTLSATDTLNGGSVALSWAGYSAQSEGISQFLIYVSPLEFSDPAQLEPVTTLSPSATSFIAQGLTDGAPWYFAVIPVDFAGNEAPFSGAASAVASAQGIHGVVTDSVTGLPLQSVLLQINGETATTNQEGFYRKPGLPTGSYAMTVSGQGYQPLQVADVTVSTGEMLRLDLTLTPETPDPSKVVNIVAEAGDEMVTVSWDAVVDANLAGYQVYRGTSFDNPQDVLLTPEPIPGTFFVDMDLTNDTTYYYVVRVVNDEGTSGPPSDTVSAMPAALAPDAAGDLQATLQADHSVKLTWSPSPTSGVTSYRIYTGTSSVDYTTPAAIVDGNVTSWTSVILPTGTTTYFGLRAEKNGLVELNTDLVVAVTNNEQPSTVPSVRLTSPTAGEKIYGDSIPVAVEISSGSNADIERVTFQYRPLGGATWRTMTPADMAYQNPDLAAPYLTYWDCRLLADGQYELRAVARDQLGNSDSQASIILIAIDSQKAGKKGWRNDKVRQGLSKKIKRAKNNLLELYAPQDASPYQVIIPTGTLASDTALTAELLQPEELDHTLPAAASLQRYLRLVLGNGQETFAAGSEVELSFPYPDSDGDGLVDGLNIPPHALQLMWYNRVAKAWETTGITEVTVDTVRHVVHGKTAHFSDFALLGPGAGLAVTIDPVTTPNAANDLPLTGTVSEGATVEVTATAGSPGSVTYPTTTTWSCVLSGLPEGNLQVSATATDGTTVTTPQTLDLLIDHTLPSGSVLINGGAATTTTRSVTLTLNASDAGTGVTQMIISNNGIPWTSWIPYVPTYDLILPAGDGGKTVYVQYADAAGNQSPVYQDTILLQSSTAAAIQPGTNVTVTPTADVKMTFSQVTTAGNLAVTDPINLSTPPNSVPLWGSERELSTTAGYSGAIEVCLGYSDDQLQYPQNEPALRLMHNNGSYWQDITVSVDQAANLVCGTTQSLSPFMIVETAPVSNGGVTGERVPVLPGWWLSPLLVIGFGLLRRRNH